MKPQKSPHDEIATFVRVVRRMTLVGAARELGVPKSTISRRITRLEERLDVKLMHRDGRKLVLTDEGRILYDRVATSVDTIDLAMQASSEGMAMPRGKIRITAPPDVGRMFLVKKLAAFGMQYPEISLELELTDRYVDLVQEGFDLAIRAGSGPDTSSGQNLLSRKLMSGILKLAGSAAQAEKIRTVDDLSRSPFVLFRATAMQQILRLKSGAGPIHHIPVSGRFVVHDYISMAELVADGVGLGLIPQIHLDNPPSPDAFQPILPELSTTSGDVLLVYPTRHLPRRVSLLIEYLVP